MMSCPLLTPIALLLTEKHPAEKDTEIQLQPNNFNRDTELSNSQSCNPATNTVQQNRASKQQWMER
jgi:hypothetical protein